LAEHLESPEALKSVQATGALKVRPIACSDVVIALVDQPKYVLAGQAPSLASQLPQCPM
jgi:hypothetical protein